MLCDCSVNVKAAAFGLLRPTSWRSTDVQCFSLALSRAAPLDYPYPGPEFGQAPGGYPPGVRQPPAGMPPQRLPPGESFVFCGRFAPRYQ